jgi:hypothetical protein
MAVEIIRNASIYVENLKVGNAETAEVDINANNEHKIGDGEMVGIAQGVTTSAVKLTSITPVGGSVGTRKLVRALLDKTPVRVSLAAVEGWAYMWDNLWVDNATHASNMAKGDLTGSFALSGGEPTLVDL